MKVKELSQSEKVNFKKEILKYEVFLKHNLTHLAQTSLSLYKRTLAYISVINKLYDLSIKDTCIFLTRAALTDNTLDHIIGNNKVTDNNKNIRLSAYKNLVEIFKQEIKKEISSVAFNTIMEKMAKAGGNIRKNIFVSRQNKDIETNPLSNLTWEELQDLNKDYLKKFKHVKNQFIKYGEVPDYVFLRDCLVCNLYTNNVYKVKSLEFNVILRNEYKSLYLHIGEHQPTTNTRNYIWINLENNNSKIIINKNKTTGGYKRCLGNDLGHTKLIPQKDQKIFPLNKEIVNIILFIQQIFNERKDKPFIKCNNREINYSSSTWSKMLCRVFKRIDNKISSSVIRKIYYQKLQESNLKIEDKQIIHEMCDFSPNVHIFEQEQIKDNIQEGLYEKEFVEENLKMFLGNQNLSEAQEIQFL